MTDAKITLRSDPKEVEAWFVRRVCTGGEGKEVEMGKATKRENLGKWYVRDFYGVAPDALHPTFQPALIDYMERCLTIRLKGRKNLPGKKP